MKTKGDYLRFYKTVLDRMRFDMGLFWKEYQKAAKVLSPKEKKDLDLWIKQQIS
jgi:hypothetical protein